MYKGSRLSTAFRKYAELGHTYAVHCDKEFSFIAFLVNQIVLLHLQ